MSQWKYRIETEVVLLGRRIKRLFAGIPRGQKVFLVQQQDDAAGQEGDEQGTQPGPQPEYAADLAQEYSQEKNLRQGHADRAW